MKKYLDSKILILLIVLLAAFVRFYAISSTAPALNWDEAALGYNSYTLGLDGRDEFGKLLPISYLESYGDFKPVVYSYLGILPLKLFGLNEFGVRFPSAFLGTLTVLLTFFLVKEIFPKRELSKKTEYVALLSAFILALSPWHIMLSRGAYEANVSTFFIVLGIYAFLRGVNKNGWFLVLSAISIAITFYTFNTARVFIPLLGFIFILAFRKELLKNWKQALIAGLVGLIIILPTIPFMISPQAKLRFTEVNIFSDSSIIETSNKYVLNDNNVFWSKIIHNRRVLYGIEFSKHYLDNLNPGFLFITGDGNPRFATGDVGQLYLWDLPFLIVGIFILFRKKEGHFWILPIWFLIGLIPAATARETPHALRIETVIPTLQIITAYGFIALIFMLKKYRSFVATGFIILLMLNFIYFYHGLMVHYSREYSSEWQYPYKELVSYVNSNNNKYDQIIVTNKLGRPYIYFLLYGKVNPKEFRQSAKIDREALGFVHVRGFDKYSFADEAGKVETKGKTLFIEINGEQPQGIKIIKNFKLKDGKTALVAYEKN